MEKCCKCDNEAKWKSVKGELFCSECARKITDELKANMIHPEEYAVSDFFDGIPNYNPDNLKGNFINK